MKTFFRILTLLAIASALTLSSCRSHHKKNNTPKPPIVKIDNKKLKGVEKKIVAEAMTWVGTPYKYGGNDKKKGTDCSGMVLRVYEDVAGVKLPRNSAKQSEFCKRINKKDVRPGDLVFFATGRDPKKISHVGIMVDDDNFVHSSSSKGVVVSSVSTPYYIRTFIMYGRVPN